MALGVARAESLSLGLRWQAQRDTAFPRAKDSQIHEAPLALESAFAAPALPAQSMTP